MFCGDKLWEYDGPGCGIVSMISCGVTGGGGGWYSCSSLMGTNNGGWFDFFFVFLNLLGLCCSVIILKFSSVIDQ